MLHIMLSWISKAFLILTVLVSRQCVTKLYIGTSTFFPSFSLSNVFATNSKSKASGWSKLYSFRAASSWCFSVRTYVKQKAHMYWKYSYSLGQGHQVLSKEGHNISNSQVCGPHYCFTDNSDSLDAIRKCTGIYVYIFFFLSGSTKWIQKTLSSMYSHNSAQFKIAFKRAQWQA